MCLKSILSPLCYKSIKYLPLLCYKYSQNLPLLCNKFYKFLPLLYDKILENLPLLCDKNYKYAVQMPYLMHFHYKFKFYLVCIYVIYNKLKYLKKIFKSNIINLNKILFEANICININKKHKQYYIIY